MNGEWTEQSVRFKKSQVLFSFRVDAVLVGSLYGGVNWVRRTLNHGQSVSVTFIFFIMTVAGLPMTNLLHKSEFST